MSTKLLKLLKEILKEMSATAAGPGTATVTPGSGEGVATKYGFSNSWVGGRKLKKKKKK